MRAAPLSAIAILALAGCLTPSLTGAVSPAATSASALGAPTFTSVRTNPGGFEPRIAAGPNGTAWLSTQAANGAEVVYGSSDGGLTWAKTPSDPGTQSPCCDNEIAVTPTGRILSSIIGSENGQSGLVIHYSDDLGKTWTASKGNVIADQDRQWLAVGPRDPQTGQFDVYMLWHNLLSGAADHEMLVSTSHDGGANFGPPVPIALPGTQAWLDLQCADSGGPSNIFTNPSTGQIYAVFATRSSVAGGCGASVTQSFQINVVAATRIWVATSKDRGMTWTDVLAVDDSTAGNIVGMQVNAGTIDDKGNVYVVYPESPQPYPNYDGAAVKYKWAPGDLSHWSPAVTVEASVGGGKQLGAGHVLTHIAAGDPGKLAIFYLTGDGNGTKALWYPTVAQTYDGLDANPQFTYLRVSNIAAWQGSASQLMGVCNPSLPFPASVASSLQDAACPRSSDVLGQALNTACHATFIWTVDSRLNKDASGTYVTTQTGGTPLCAPGNLTVMK
ncbi:MAG: sialidase family protein [Thermoplasmatota archaeon]